MASSVEREGAREEVVSVELPAPPGWKKKVFVFLYAIFLHYFALYEFHRSSFLEFLVTILLQLMFIC